MSESSDSSWSDDLSERPRNDPEDAPGEDDEWAELPSREITSRRPSRTEKRAVFRKTIGIPEQEGIFVEKEAPRPKSPLPIPPPPEVTPTVNAQDSNAPPKGKAVSPWRKVQKPTTSGNQTSKAPTPPSKLPPPQVSKKAIKKTTSSESSETQVFKHKPASSGISSSMQSTVGTTNNRRSIGKSSMAGTNRRSTAKSNVSVVRLPDQPGPKTVKGSSTKSDTDDQPERLSKAVELPERPSRTQERPDSVLSLEGTSRPRDVEEVTVVESRHSGPSIIKKRKSSVATSKYGRVIQSRPHFSVNEKTMKIGRTQQLQDTVLRPEGYLPENSLDTWKGLNPDVKLPDIRDKTLGEIYYTRGRLGQKLYRQRPEVEFSDPYSRSTVSDPKEYTALHDPHCKSYFKRRSVMDHLKKQELVNNKGEVLCNVNEFNKYRSYLGSLFNDQVRRRISEKNAIIKMETNIKKSMYLHSRQVQTQQSRHRLLENFKETQTRQKHLSSIYEAAKKARYQTKIREWQRRVDNIERNKSQLLIAKSGEYTSKHWNAYLTRKKAGKTEEKKKKRTLTRIAYTEARNEYVTKYDEFVKLALFERYKADQAAVMIARDDQIADMEQLVAETLKRSKATWLKEYNNYVETNREIRARRREAKRTADTRRHYLRKKYFAKWRRFVVRNRENFDKDHHTVFGIRKQLWRVNNLKKKLGGWNAFMGGGDASKPFDNDNSRASRSPKIRASQWRDKTRYSYYDRRSTTDKGDLDKADKYIDGVVNQYKLDNDLLQTKLKGSASLEPPLFKRHSHPSSLSSSRVNSVSEVFLNEDQEDQKGRIEFLSDMNEVGRRLSKPEV